jgi:hypothetical protein
MPTAPLAAASDAPPSAPDNWLTTAEVLTEFGFTAPHLWRDGCLALGRPIKSRPAPEDMRHPRDGRHHGGFLYFRPDLEQIKSTIDNPPGPRWTDATGQVWLTASVAKAPPYRFPTDRLRRWHEDDAGCPFLDADQPRKLSAQKVAVSVGSGSASDSGLT